MKSADHQSLKASLSALYADQSKHSSYQSIPDFVANTIDYQVRIQEDWRGDRVRLAYIQSKLASPDLERWCDFGANTGFFTLTLAHGDPERRLLAVEANPNHAAFIEAIARAFDMDNVEVLGPVTLATLPTIRDQDVMLHLNVLHHAGADFDSGAVTGPEDFLAYAETYLRTLRQCTRKLVFQVGSNLWGDKSRPIIDFRADAEKLLLFATLLDRSGWDIDEVAYPANAPGEPIEYRPLDPGLTTELSGGRQSPSTSELESALAGFNLAAHKGEFYRRPLFFCSRRA